MLQLPAAAECGVRTTPLSGCAGHAPLVCKPCGWCLLSAFNASRCPLGVHASGQHASSLAARPTISCPHLGATTVLYAPHGFTSASRWKGAARARASKGPGRCPQRRRRQQAAPDGGKCPPMMPARHSPFARLSSCKGTGRVGSAPKAVSHSKWRSPAAEGRARPPRPCRALCWPAASRAAPSRRAGCWPQLARHSLLCCWFWQPCARATAISWLRGSQQPWARCGQRHQRRRCRCRRATPLPPPRRRQWYQNTPHRRSQQLQQTPLPCLNQQQAATPPDWSEGRFRSCHR